MSTAPPYALLRLGEKTVGTAKYFTGGSTNLCRTLHGCPLHKFAEAGQDLVVIYSVQVFSEFLDVPYPYSFGGPEDPPKTLGDLNKQEGHFKSLVAWDNRYLVPHRTGCELKDSPRIVTAQDFFPCSRVTVIEKTGKTVRWQDRAARDSEHESENAAAASSDSSTHSPQHGRLTNEASEPPFHEGSASSSLVRNSFCRIRKKRTSDVDLITHPQNTGNSEHELAQNINAVQSSTHDFEDEIQSSKSAGETQREISQLPTEPASIVNEDDHTGDAAESVIHGTGGESDPESEDNSSSDDSVDVRSCSNVIPFPQKRAYVYRTRKRGIPQGPRDLRKRRKFLSQRMDNPFLTTGLRCCKANRCYEKVDPTYAFKTYKELMSMNREDFKSFLINIYDSQAHSFTMLGRPVCARYLQKGFGFSNDLQCSVKNTHGARAGPSCFALPRDVRRTTKKNCIISFLRNYADECGDMMPNALFTNLPDAGRSDVYRKFVKDFQKNHPSESPPVVSFFYAVWKAHCTGIRTRRNHGFSRCETCVFLKAEIAENQSRGSIVRQATLSLRQHLDFVMEERRMYQNRSERAIRLPKKYMSIVVDGADQKAYGLPHFLEKSKSDRGHKFKVKCVGCLEHKASKKLRVFAMTEEFLTGANHIIEVIHRTLTSRKDETGRLPEVLYLQVDNCTRENKNRYLLGYLEMLVALGVFLEVEVSFLPVGHTHTDIDQAFSVVSRILSRLDTATMAELIYAIDSCYLGKASAVRLDKIANFSGLCERSKCLVNASSLGGLMNLRYFRFTRAAGDMLDDGVFKTQCHVKVQCMDDWQPLSVSRIKGILKQVPDLRRTPPTETFPPDNVVEINKCLESIHGHSRKLAARVIPEQEALRDVVYTRREDPFHWNLESSIELKGNFMSDGHQGGSDSEEEIMLDDDTIPEYEAESFVAVKPPQGTKNRFWIAMVLKVIDRSSSNKPRWLQVLWHSQKRGGRDEFSAKFVPSQVYDSRRKRHVPYEEQIEVATILLHFQSLNSHGHLHANTSSALRQVLGLN